MSLTLDLKNVHKYRRLPGTTQTVLDSTHPAVGITAHGHPRIWVQHGKVWTENKVELTSPPDWFWEELGKCSSEALKGCGGDALLAKKEGKPVVVETQDAPDFVPTPGAPDDGWRCPKCGIGGITSKKRGAHAMNHARRKE